MKISKVSLTDFRNYSTAQVEFEPSLNVIEGRNTAGKTNLMEAVYCCGVGKSPRANKDRDMIRFGQEEAHITVWVDKRFRSHRIDYHLTQRGLKKVLVDNQPIRRMADLMGVLNVVYFSPDELKIIKDEPSERRRFVNISLCQQNPAYYTALSNYNKVLEQRNALLKEETPTLREELAIWDEQLAKEGAIIVHLRQDFLTKIATLADRYHRLIAGEQNDLSLTYVTQVVGDTVEDTRNLLLARLKAGYDKELHTHYTVTGPHRDDFVVESLGQDLKQFGSQGQQRTAALSLKLAEIKYFEEHTGEQPILLLDDVLSELDSHRRGALLKATEGIQTLLTCTEFDEEYEAGKVIHIENGEVK